MLTGRKIAVVMYAFFQINDEQGRACGMNIELRSDSLKMFDQAWEETHGNGNRT